jgi:hypothetical protein
MISERPASVSPHRALVVRRRISGASKRDCEGDQGDPGDAGRHQIVEGSIEPA